MLSLHIFTECSCLQTACALSNGKPKYRCRIELLVRAKDDGWETGLVAAHLLFDILAVIVAVLAMRSVGLFYRHYSCYFGWKRCAL